jgi:excinuclease ABC subunit B
VAEEVAEYEAIAGMPPDEVVKLGKRLEREMAKAARDLQFERAAQLRDQLIGLRKAMTDSRAVAEEQPVGAAPGPAREPGRRGGGRWRRGR